MRKALWSLLVGVAAALPAVHGVRELPITPTEAPARPSPVVEQAKKTEADTLLRADVDQDRDDDPAPVFAFAAPRSVSPVIPPAPRLQAAPPESPDLAPLARRSMRLPQPRAPDVRAAS